MRRVDYRSKVLSTLGTVAAMDEKAAIRKAAELFNITFANQAKLVVTRIDIESEAAQNKKGATFAAP